MHRPQKINYQSGLTLIEVLVVLGLFTIVAALLVVASLGDYRAYLFRGDRDMVINVLQKARSQAINNICLGAGCTGGQPHGAHFESGKYVVFQAPAATPNYANRITSLDEIITVNDPVFVSGLSDVVFLQLSGQVTTPGTVTVFDSVGHTGNITINSEGQIDW